ncbi:hypothetical protein Zmor_016854 [Zophobas morio]|uniref:Uncharacterized protein n=1 Tax=Zophobas morio TaxID=2755281 RepID=A0AA38IBF6_9CUCU|nr:hypothetical protein Zmor_016854 [Zophobas morio]
MATRESMDFDSFMDCESIAASTEEILWSDDETIIAEQESIWHQGKKKMSVFSRFFRVMGYKFCAILNHLFRLRKKLTTIKPHSYNQLMASHRVDFFEE